MQICLKNSSLAFKMSYKKEFLGYIFNFWWLFFPFYSLGSRLYYAYIFSNPNCVPEAVVKIQKRTSTLSNLLICLLY